MKKYEITNVREAVERTIVELTIAIQNATIARDRMAARNLDLRLEAMNNLLRNIREHEAYITQPRFKDCFGVEGKKEANDNSWEK